MINFFRNLISPAAAGRLQAAVRSGALLIDVRTPAEFATGSVPGAINMPLTTLGNDYKKIKNKKSIIVFCRSGARSAQAKNLLIQKGIPNVINGGTWKQVQKATL